MKRLLHPVLGAALAVLVVASLQLWGRRDEGRGPWEVAERKLLDLRFQLRGAQQPDPSLALVVLDDATFERDEELFKRRAGWARVVRAVKSAGAKVIAIDSVFVAPEAPLRPALGQRVTAWAEAHPAAAPDAAAEALLLEVAEDLRGDAELAAAVAESKPVVLAVFAGRTSGSFAEGVNLSRGRYGQSVPGAVVPHAVEGIDPSIAPLVEAAHSVGFATAYQDDTATVRRVELAIGWRDGVYYPLAVATLAAHLEVPRGRLAWLGPQQQVRVGDRAIALQGNGVWLNYRGRGKTFPTYSASTVVEGKLPADALAGKTVLLGVTRRGYDAAVGPFSELPGVEVQATVLDNLLAGDWLRRSGSAWDLVATLGVGLLVALSFALRRAGLGTYVAVAVVAIGAWLLASSWAFSARALWLPWLGPIAAAVAAFGAGVSLALGREAQRRHALKAAFAHYLGKDALEELLANPEKLVLGGERRQLTVLFSDICGFTTLSEKMAPDRLVAFLNTYLSPMTRSVLDLRGLLDKYIGDAVMAVFGAPVPVENHAATALSCALAMHRDLEALNAGPLADLGEPLRIGVGINTGDMVVGNMGSADRFDYTVAGDAVNLASRLEGLTRTYGVFCLVGEATVRAAGPGFVFRPLDLVQVKGKNVGVEVFELLEGPARKVAAPALLERWAEGLAAWRAGKLPEARLAFTAFHARNPGDIPVMLYLDRLAALPEHAPPDFSAVAKFTQK
jgi:adenylate cyclase